MMKRLRLGAMCAGIAAGLAVSYGVLAHDFSALKDGSGSAVRSGFGDCVETSGALGGCGKAATAAAAPAMADKAAMTDKKEMMADKKDAMPAATVAAAGASTALGNHQIGEATHGHLADGQKRAVHTGFGGCVNLGYSVNSPDHPAECEYQAPAKVAAAQPKEAAKPAPEPAPAAPAAPPTPEPAAPAAAAPSPAPAVARAVPAAPAVSVPGTVRNTNPIGAGDAPEAVAMAEDTSANDGSGLPPRAPRGRRAPGALVENGMPQDMAAAPSGDSELKPSPTPPAVPAPPSVIVRGRDDAMDVLPPPARPQGGGAVAAAPAAPSAPPVAVPGTVRNTAPQADSAAPQGDVQMPKAKPGTVPAPEYEKISLSADVLFKFDKYRDKDMLPGGREKLNDVADKINSYIKDTLEGINLTGHTDRLGSDAYNQRLSERRAKTVKNYLVKKGVDASKISSSGHGEREPVVQCKGNKPTKKLIACLQPNRRVDVEIRGTKQK